MMENTKRIAKITTVTAPGINPDIFAYSVPFKRTSPKSFRLLINLMSRLFLVYILFPSSSYIFSFV